MWPIETTWMSFPRTSTNGELCKSWWTKSSQHQNLLVKRLDSKGHKTEAQPITHCGSLPPGWPPSMLSFLVHMHCCSPRGGVYFSIFENGLACDFFDQKWCRVLSLAFTRISCFCFSLVRCGERIFVLESQPLCKKFNYPAATMLWGSPSHMKKLHELGDIRPTATCHPSQLRIQIYVWKSFQIIPNPTTSWLQPHGKPRARTTLLSLINT